MPFPSDKPSHASDSTTASDPPPHHLPPIRRIVTAHNPSGRATIAFDTLIRGTSLPDIRMYPLWQHASLPPNVNADPAVDRSLLPTAITNDGPIFRVADFPPRYAGPLHRTISLDYLYVLKGRVTLVLDDGSRTEVREGDAVVQQATMHGWENETDEWVRVLSVMIRSEKPVTAQGEVLEEDISRMG